VSVTALLTGCGGETPEPSTPSEPPTPSTVAAPEATASAEPPPAPPSGKRAPCTYGADQTCNANPAVSALWGRCTELGVCECNDGFRLNPGGACEPAK
jgi:hypothetical protein